MERTEKADAQYKVFDEPDGPILAEHLEKLIQLPMAKEGVSLIACTLVSLTPTRVKKYSRGKELAGAQQG